MLCTGLSGNTAVDLKPCSCLRIKPTRRTLHGVFLLLPRVEYHGRVSFVPIICVCVLQVIATVNEQISLPHQLQQDWHHFPLTGRQFGQLYLLCKRGRPALRELATSHDVNPSQS